MLVTIRIMAKIRLACQYRGFESHPLRQRLRKPLITLTPSRIKDFCSAYCSTVVFHVE